MSDCFLWNSTQLADTLTALTPFMLSAQLTCGLVHCTTQDTVRVLACPQ